MALQIGDLIHYNNEYGIVCHLDPDIMTSVEFHSYVPIQTGSRLVMRSANPQCTIKPEIVERIRAYLLKSVQEKQTCSQCNDENSH